MKTLALPALGLTAVLVASCVKPTDPAPADDEKAKPAAEGKVQPVAEPLKDVPAALVPVFEKQNRLHKRQTGALLTITSKWVHDPGLEPGIRVDWTIDYDGPRRPFTILAPRGATGPNPATAHCWYLKPDGAAAAVTWGLGGGYLAGIQPRKQRDWFAVAADGKPVTGHKSVGITTLKGRFGRYPEPNDPRMWVQMEYTPTDRGDGFDVVVDPVTRESTQGPTWTFDAWTGKLWSPVVEVTLNPLK